jgi:hypothetical protein
MVGGEWTRGHDCWAIRLVSQRMNENVQMIGRPDHSISDIIIPKNIFLRMVQKINHIILK